MISDIAEIHLHNATYYENLISEHKMVLSFTLGKNKINIIIWNLQHVGAYGCLEHELQQCQF